MIIFINGPINSGKSTIAKLLAEKISNTAVVEIDALRTFIKWMPLAQAIPINLKNAVSVIKNFEERGIHSVIPYPLSENNYLYLSKALASYKDNIHTFTLAPKEEIVLQNRGNRKLTNWEKERIKHHYQVGIHKIKFGITIDNSEQTPAETITQILAYLSNQSTEVS